MPFASMFRASPSPVPSFSISQPPPLKGAGVAMKSATSSKRPIAPLKSTSNSSERTDRSVEIDLSGVALAPGQGPPPVPLLQNDVDMSTTRNNSPGAWSRQVSWPDQALNGVAPKSMHEKRAMSNFEEISPWSFQGNDSVGLSRPKARSRQVGSSINIQMTKE